MNILFLPKWYPNINDVQHGIFIKNQALAISKFANVGVLFVVTSDQVKEEKIEITRDGNYFELICYFPKRSNRLFALYNYYKSFTRAKEKLEAEWGKPDVINLYILGRNYMMYKKFWSGIPLVVSEQWSGYLNGGMEKYIYAKRKNTLNALKKANQIIAVSHPLAMALKKYSGRDEIKVIPNIVFSGRISENKLENQIRVLTVADLDDAVKNISEMILVLQRVSDTLSIHFTIIGEGKDEIKLKELAKNYSNNKLIIEFKKRMPHYELLNEYSNSNFYFLNSPHETFCVAAAESIASGRPVVSTRCGGPEEYITGKNGLFFTGKQITDKVETILEMIERLRQNSYPPNQISKEIIEKYGANAIATQYINVFKAANNKK